MNFNKELLKLNQRLKLTISKERYQHSIRVMKKALEYASIYNIDESIVKITALAHDLAREIPKDICYNYIKENNLSSDLLDEENFPLLHGAIAADICKKKYNFTDDMANAVFYHTTGRSNMSTLEKIIYLADKNEDERRHIGIKEQRKIAKESLDKGMIVTLKNSIRYNKEQYNKININSLEALRFLQKNTN